MRRRSPRCRIRTHLARTPYKRSSVQHVSPTDKIRAAKKKIKLYTQSRSSLFGLCKSYLYWKIFNLTWAEMDALLVCLEIHLHVSIIKDIILYLLDEPKTENCSVQRPIILIDYYFGLTCWVTWSWSPIYVSPFFGFAIWLST